MKASALTLDGARSLVPAVIRGRYGDAFLISMGNEILADIEQECDPDYFKAETGLLLQDGITDYALPDSVRHVRGVYEVPAGDIIPDREHPWPFQIIGNRLRLESIPSVDEEDTADIVGVTTSGSSRSILTCATAGKLDDTNIEDDELIGMLMRIITYSPAANAGTEWRIIAANDVSDKTATVNGDIDGLFHIGDSDDPTDFRITAFFLIIEHTRYLKRFTAITDLLPLSQDFEKLMRAGLKFKYHHQADELSTEAKEARQVYSDELKRFQIDTAKPRGMSTRNSPRAMPSIF